MKRMLLGLAALAVLSAGDFNSCRGQGGGNLAADRDAIAQGWRFDYEEAVGLARRTNKPLMVVFRCVP